MKIMINLNLRTGLSTCSIQASIMQHCFNYLELLNFRDNYHVLLLPDHPVTLIGTM